MKNKDLNKQFNIPAWVNGNTPAEEAASVKKRFKDRQDKASQETMEEILQNIADKQEYVKMQTALATQSKEVPDMMNGQVPQGMQQFSMGGQIAGTVLQGGLGAAGTAIGGPIGGMIGSTAGQALTPLVQGLIDNDKETAQEMGVQNALNANLNMTRAYGGYTNKYFLGGPIDPTDPMKEGAAYGEAQHFAELDKRVPNVASVGAITPSAGTAPLTTQSVIPQLNLSTFMPQSSQSHTDTISGNTPTKEGKTKAGKALDWLGRNYGDILETAPLVGALTQRIDRTESPRRDRLATTFKQTPVDEAALQNVANRTTRGTLNALRANSGGSAATFAANAAATNAGRVKALSDAYLQAENINREQQVQANQFNLRRDGLNLGQANLDEQDRQMNEAAYQSARSARRAAIFEDAAKFGKQQVDKRLVKEMFGYSWDGKYYRDKNGEIVTNEDGTPLSQQDLAGKIGATAPKANANMLGGYLKRR